MRVSGIRIKGIIGGLSHVLIIDHIPSVFIVDIFFINGHDEECCNYIYIALLRPITFMSHLHFGYPFPRD